MAKRGGHGSHSPAAHTSPPDRLFEPEGYRGGRRHPLLPGQPAAAMALVFEASWGRGLFPPLLVPSFPSRRLPAQPRHRAGRAGELPGGLRPHGTLLARPLLCRVLLAHTGPRPCARLVSGWRRALDFNPSCRPGKGAGVGPFLVVGGGLTNCLPGLFRLLFRDGIASLHSELSFLSRGLEHR